MNILIFEGIASSGKTTLERLLVETLPNAKIITEGDTLMPLIENRDPEIAVQHLTKLLEAFQKETVEYLIIDRFHFTHAFRTHTPLNAFLTIENTLHTFHKTTLVLLTIDKDRIKARLEETAAYRKDQWKKGKQGTLEEKAVYYTEQQEQLIRFQEQSTLPSITLDTTNKDWERCLMEIKKAIGL